MERNQTITQVRYGRRHRDAGVVIGVSLVLAIVAIVAFIATLPG